MGHQESVVFISLLCECRRDPGEQSGCGCGSPVQGEDGASGATLHPGFLFLSSAPVELPSRHTTPHST